MRKLILAAGIAGFLLSGAASTVAFAQNDPAAAGSF